MNTNSINRLIADESQDVRKKKKDTGDKNLFADNLKEATEKETKSDKLIASSKDHSKEVEKKNEQVKKDQVKQEQTKLKQQKFKEQLGVKDYSQRAVQHDPSKLSIAERQAFRLGEFNQKSPQMLQQMQSVLGDNAKMLKGLNPDQMSKFSGKFIEMAQNALAQKGGEKVVDPKKLTELVKEFSEQVATQQSSKSDPANAGALLQNMDEILSQGQEEAKDKQKMIDQILSHIEVNNLANQTEINLKLNPEYLGDMRIKLTHDERGVKAHFETSSKKTKELLAGSEHEMVAQAEKKGIRLRAMAVTLVDQSDLA